jgi:hypothetical protein
MITSPLLTDDHVRGVLDACGYRSASTSLRGGRLLPPGSAVMLQFGDQVTLGKTGRPHMTIQCSVRISGEDDRTDRVTKWQIGKAYVRGAESDGFVLAIEADFLLGSHVPLTDIALFGGDTYRYLRLLVADARSTLRELHIDRRQSAPTGPAVRIEARQFRDLIAGRSGLVKPHRQHVSARYLSLTRAACDWLADAVLPDLGRGVRRALARANLPTSVKAPGQGTSMLDGIRVVEDVSLMPEHLPAQ